MLPPIGPFLSVSAFQSALTGYSAVAFMDSSHPSYPLLGVHASMFVPP